MVPFLPSFFPSFLPFFLSSLSRFREQRDIKSRHLTFASGRFFVSFVVSQSRSRVVGCRVYYIILYFNYIAANQIKGKDKLPTQSAIVALKQNPLCISRRVHSTRSSDRAGGRSTANEGKRVSWE